MRLGTRQRWWRIGRAALVCLSEGRIIEPGAASLTGDRHSHGTRLDTPSILGPRLEKEIQLRVCP